MAKSNPDLPLHLINIILKQADLDIYTRLYFHIKPSKLKKDLDQSFYDKMKEIHNRRASYWNEYEEWDIWTDGDDCKLESFTSKPFIELHKKTVLHFKYGFWNGNLKGAIYAYEVIFDPKHPRRQITSYVSRYENFLVHSGESCTPWYDYLTQHAVRYDDVTESSSEDSSDDSSVEE
jgi:hypothetical protein